MQDTQNNYHASNHTQTGNHDEIKTAITVS